MVVISSPSCITANERQEFTRRPLIWTVHAPHCPWSHPFLVPVIPMFSRRQSSRVVRGSSWSLCSLPLIRSVTGKPVCGGVGVDGVEGGSGVAGGTALANGAVVASRPTEPSRDRKARREEEPNPEGASVPGPLFLLVSSDMISEFGSGVAAS